MGVGVSGRSLGCTLPRVELRSTLSSSNCRVLTTEIDDRLRPSMRRNRPGSLEGALSLSRRFRGASRLHNLVLKSGIWAVGSQVEVEVQVQDRKSSM